MTCPNCRKEQKHPLNILSIQKQGECLNCAHIRAEFNEVILREMAYEQGYPAPDSQEETFAAYPRY